MRAAELILRTRLRPRVAVVLGSGLGAWADCLTSATRLSYSRLGLPRAAVPGHPGRLVVGLLNGVPVAALAGRAHLYQGYSADEITLPVRVLAATGVRTLVLTSAVGALDAKLKPGTLAILRDHINLQGTNPLRGLAPCFLDLTDTYSVRLRRLALSTARRLRLRAAEAVYAGVLGPCYETPAEVRMLHRLGADVVGMSMVSEAIAARRQGMDVLAICCVTNLAAGLSRRPLTHDDVLRAAARSSLHLSRLLAALLPRIAAA